MSATPAIVVPLDGSEFSETAIPLAAAVSLATNTGLDLVRVQDPPSLLPSDALAPLPVINPEAEAAIRQANTEWLDRVATELRAKVAVRVRMEMLDGPVGPAVGEYAHRVGANLIVLATHGRGGFALTLMGSVASDILRSARVPVLMVRPREGMARPEPRPFEHVLIPLDGSPLSETAIGPAIALLGGARRVTLMEVTSPIPLDALAMPAPLAMVDPASLADAVRLSRDYLEGIATKLRAQGFTLDVRAETATSAAATIAAALRETKADLVAMATHGRGAIGRFLLGSVSHAVLRTAEVPVLLYRPPSL